MNYIGDMFLHQIYRETHLIKMLSKIDQANLIYSFPEIRLGTFNFFYCMKIE